MSLNAADMNELQVVAKVIVNANMERYQEFVELGNSIVDRNKWKLVKSKDEVRVYLERAQRRHYSPLSTYLEGGASSDLQSLLCVGRTPGTLEDVMYGIVSPTLEGTRTKASYTNDISGAAVLSTVREPTDNEPFRSVVVKWMELDVRLKSMGFVKNRDYVYVESTGIEELPDGERVGYHVMHSIDIPQGHVLPGRVRAKLSICSFFRQVNEDYVSVYVMGMMDPMSDRVRRLVVPSFVKTLLSTLNVHAWDVVGAGD
ncbi:hypothetical protein BBJ29_006004 [Phytophthora kernoviae]|uniref:START domain-containing protein n=1 Tax=Phytophthora kernoviae TaxID=325452 RepID=A0A3F2RJ48_9STRA|nr:hypothetical protein BBP00_00007842 [Phytophthora kernoviae]RLN70229.1 hypothetical protein BBJ29_006004 [Phytophthora kernoviae]